MPSFDVVSEVDMHEAANAVDPVAMPSSTHGIKSVPPPSA